jgi:hypothetical protein
MNRNIALDPPERESQAATRRAEELRRSRSSTSRLWERAQATWSKHYNSKHKPKSYAPGDLVLLSAKNIQLSRPSKKLSDRFLGPFTVLKVVGKNAYTLALPKKYGRLHNTFHVALLEPFTVRPGRSPPAPIDIAGEEEWEVEQVLDVKSTKAGWRYLVRWTGFSEAEDTWEPAEHLLNAQDLVADFRKRRGLD